MRKIHAGIMGIMVGLVGACGGRAETLPGDVLLGGDAGAGATFGEAGQAGDRTASAGRGNDSSRAGDGSGTAGRGDSRGGSAGRTPSGGRPGDSDPGEPVGAGGLPPTNGGSVSVAGMGVPVGGGVGVPIPPIGRPGGGGEIPPAENCTPQAQSASTDHCQVELACDNDYIYTSCFSEGGDRLYCECGSQFGYRSYQVTGAEVSSACETVSELCASGEEAEFGELMCSQSQQSEGPNYCESQQECTQSAELGGGVSVIRNEWRYASCYGMTSSSLQCDCQANNRSQSYQLEGIDSGSGCEVVMDLCTSDVEPDFDGPKQCQNEFEGAGNGYCEIAQQCTQSAEIDDGVTAIQRTWQHASCHDQQDGAALCYCNAENTSLRFDIPTESIDSSTCSTALSICPMSDAIELSGPVACERAFQSASRDYCDSQIACSQQGSLDGVELQVYGDLHVSCQLSASGAPWSCRCQSGVEASTFESEEEDGWDVCTEASMRCPELVDVVIGQSGGGFVGRPPVPFP